MATTTRDTQGDRRLLVAALGLLAVVTGVTFGRVFQGTHPALRLALAGLIAVAIGALTERRHLALSLLASAVGLVVALGVLVFPGTTWAGIPSPDTLEAITDALARAGERAAVEIAPAPPLPSLMTAAMIAVWSACAAAHALAARAAATVLPLLPGAALLGFVGVVTEEPPRPAYVFAFLAATFALLFAETLVRTGGWTGGRARRAVVSTRWARTLGLGAMIVALGLPGLLPGYRTGPVLRLDEGADRVSVSPIVDIRPSLLRNPAAELFRVRADRPSYWRMVVLDQFDGNVWSSSGLENIQGSLIDGVAVLDGGAAESGARLDQEFEIRDFATSWLPAAPHPLAVTVDAELGARHDTDTGVLALDAPAEEGVRYRVISSTPVPSPADLDEIDPSDYLPRYQELPSNLPFRLRQIAAEVTATADTPFRKILALQEHLRLFRYDEHAPAGHGTNAMLNFLEETRQGYCEQFAGTMAVLIRTLGLPSRVAIGFLPGERDRTGTYRVDTGQVHAWPEVFFERYGWLPFEPTPGRSNPGAEYLIRLPTEARPDANLGRVGRGRQLSERERFQREPQTGVRPDATPRARRTDGPTSPWRLLFLSLLALGVIAVLTIPPVKAVRRRLALRDRGDPRARVIAAYRWLQGGAADLGMGRRRGETLWEYRTRMAREASTDGALDRLTSLAGRAIYSEREIEPREADEAIAAARGVLQELRKETGPARTLAGALRPGD